MAPPDLKSTWFMTIVVNDHEWPLAVMNQFAEIMNEEAYDNELHNLHLIENGIEPEGDDMIITRYYCIIENERYIKDGAAVLQRSLRMKLNGYGDQSNYEEWLKTFWSQIKHPGFTPTAPKDVMCHKLLTDEELK